MKRITLSLMILSAAVAGTALVGSTPAFAEAIVSRSAPTIANMDKGQILSWLDQLNRDLNDKKAYGHVKDNGRHEIEGAEGIIRNLLGRVKTLDELSEPQRVELFNANEKIISVLNDSEKDRLVCVREYPTGSHRPVVSCMTVAERDHNREESQKAALDLQKQQQTMKSN